MNTFKKLSMLGLTIALSCFMTKIKPMENNHRFGTIDISKISHKNLETLEKVSVTNDSTFSNTIT